MSLLLANNRNARYLHGRLARQSCFFFQSKQIRGRIRPAPARPLLRITPLERFFSTVNAESSVSSSAEVLFPLKTDKDNLLPVFDTSLHPLGVLKDYLLNTKKVVIKNEKDFRYKSAELTNEKGEKLLYWTARFVLNPKNPVLSGLLKGSEFLYSHVEEACYYSRKTTARAAAAGRYLDLISRGDKYCFQKPNLLHSFREHYETKHKIILPDSPCDVTKQDGLYHATFTCPVSKKLYNCGILVAANDYKIIDSKVYYPICRLAFVATVANVLDDLTGSTLCVVKEAMEPAHSSFDGVPEQKYGDMVFTEGEDIYFVSEDVNSEGIVVKSENDDDELMISRIPEAVGVAPARRLLEITSTARQLNTPDAGKINLGSFARSGFVDPLSSVKTARAWARSLSESFSVKSSEFGNPHRLTLSRKDSGSTLLRGNAILSSLAEATQASPIGSTFGAQEVAVEIIDALWKTETSKPDVETYILYLKCLDDAHPLSAVRKAEKTIASMQRGALYKNTEYILPKPNRDTINSLIQLSAQLGGSSGRQAKFTDGGFVPNRESFLSVLSSSIYRPVKVYESGGFDPVFARSCIDKMSALAEETGEATLEPDTQVYNAPLKWSGGPMLWRESRPYARYCPWDNYEHLYAAGVRDNVAGPDDLRVKEAIITQEWLESMESKSIDNPRIAPDIETYEAAIQGWLRTATRRGLECAESILCRVLENSVCADSSSRVVKPRLQTFHPIIAAWRYSKEDEGPAKVYEWTRAWLEANSSENFVPDPRIVGLQLESRLSHQEAQKKILKEIIVTDHVDAARRKKYLFVHNTREIYEAAESCSRILNDLVWQLNKGSQTEDGDFKFDISLFINIVEAWQNFAATGSDGCIDVALTEASKILDTFMDVVQSMGTYQFPDGVVVVGTQPISPRLMHLVTNCQQLFCTLLDLLSSLREGSRQSTPLSHRQIEDCLLLVEKMVRLTGEFRAVDAFMAALQLQNEEAEGREDIPKKVIPVDATVTVPADRFVYGIKGHSRPVPSKFMFLLLAIRYLEKFDDSNADDIVRICMLVKDISDSDSTYKRGHSKLSDAINGVLTRVLHGFHLDYSDDTNQNGRSTVEGRVNSLSEASRLNRSKSVRERRQRGPKKRKFTPYA